MWFIGVCFSICFIMSLKGLSLCVCPPDPGDIAWLLSWLASHPCCSWWSAILSLLQTCGMICYCSYGLSFLLWYHRSTVHHLLIKLLQKTLLECPQSTIFSSNCYRRPYWNKNITSESNHGSCHFCLSLDQCLIMFIIIIYTNWWSNNCWHGASSWAIK